MELWSPREGVGLPPAEMVDAFLTGYPERSGFDEPRPLVDLGDRDHVERAVEGAIAAAVEPDFA